MSRSIALTGALETPLRPTDIPEMAVKLTFFRYLMAVAAATVRPHYG
ncbi:hypothetical protein [Bradyrhizobium japonicum]|nr:hypothetical protein [Bradyrhizobium japonicum]